MILEVSGDILLSKAKAIGHSVAPLDHFETGLALSLRERYPVMVKDFRHWGHVHHPEPGEVYEWKDEEGIRYYSLLIQEASNSNHAHGLPGKASLHNLDKCLKNLAKKLEKDEVASLAIPKMATGVGGLNWDEVKPHLYKYLDPLPTRVYLYTQYKKGERAMES